MGLVAYENHWEIGPVLQIGYQVPPDASLEGASHEIMAISVGLQHQSIYASVRQAAVHSHLRFAPVAAAVDAGGRAPVDGAKGVYNEGVHTVGTICLIR